MCPKRKQRASFDVLITTYEHFMGKADIGRLSGLRWEYIVVDEGHRLKNADCKLNRELRRYQAAHRLLLTGVSVPSYCHASCTEAAAMRDEVSSTCGGNNGRSLHMIQLHVACAGTPLQNNLEELWSLLNVLMPSVFDSAEDFSTWFGQSSIASAKVTLPIGLK